jgi:phosphohistidine phosphatase
MIVYFLRHASAGNPKNDPKKDEKRPLDAEGIEQCRLMGRALSALEVQVDAILSSPLKRATQTASLVGNEMGHDGKLELTPALRPEASYSDFRALMEKNVKYEAIMVVGHNPTLSDFLSRLIGARGAAVDLKKGAVAKADLGHGSAALQWCLTPKAVRAIYDTAAASSRPKTSRK